MSFFEGLRASTLWATIVAAFLFLPRLVHDLCVRPEENEQGRHLLTWEFGQAYWNLPYLLRTLAFKTRTADEQLRETMLRGILRRTFKRWNLVNIGVGIVIGQSCWYLNSILMGKYAGSMLFIGYLVNFVFVLLAALMYAELTIEFPVAGGPVTWTMATLGEFPAAMCLGYLLVQYTLMSAVYGTVLEISIAIIAGVDRESVYAFSYDIIGSVILIAVTFVLCLSNRSSSFVLIAANLVGVILALFTAIAGFTQASGEVFSSDWNPGGDGNGMFPALPYLMFAFTGFEAPSYSVEEAIDPAKDILPAYLWTLGISMPIYLLLALSLAFMVNMQELQQCQNFQWQGVPTSCPEDLIERYWIGVVYAFSKYGMKWMKYIFAVGALINIMTSLLVSLYITARLMMVGAREWLLPPVLATVSVRTREPIYATLLAGLIAAILCFFLTYNSMANLVGFAYLLINLLVSNVYLARRFWPAVKLRYTRYGNVEAAAPRFMNEIDGGALTGGFSSMVRSIDISSRGTNQSTFKSDTESGSLPLPCSPRYSTPLQTLPEAQNEEQQQQGTDAEINTGTDTDVDSNATNASNQTSTNPRLWKLLRIEHRMTKKTHRWMVVLFLVAINGTGIATGVVRRFVPSHHMYAIPFGAWIIVTFLMWLMCPIEYEPRKWHIHRHLLPFVPSVAILGFTFLACWIQELQQYTASLIIIGSVALVYVFVSMPLSYIRKHSTWVTSTDVREIDLVYRESKEMWIGVDELTSRPSFKNKHTFAGAHSAGG